MKTTNTALAGFARVVGTWSVTGSHPLFPGRVLRGQSTFEWIEGGAFCRMHSKMADPEIPEGVAIFGADTGDSERPGSSGPSESGSTCTMLYFDVRGVARRYEVDLHEDGFTWSRNSPKFAQRFRVTVAADGNSMKSVGEMKKDGGSWEEDLSLNYVRVSS